MAIVPFLFLDVPSAAQYMERWKPQMVAGQLLSVSGVNSYSRAHIHLQHPDCVGMLVDVRNVGFVIRKGEDETYGIVSCLWPTGEPSLHGFRDLREWCDCVLDVSVDGTHLEDERERQLWEMSTLGA